MNHPVVFRDYNKPFPKISSWWKIYSIQLLAPRKKGVLSESELGTQDVMEPLCWWVSLNMCGTMICDRDCLGLKYKLPKVEKESSFKGKTEYSCQHKNTPHITLPPSSALFFLQTPTVWILRRLEHCSEARRIIPQILWWIWSTGKSELNPKKKTTWKATGTDELHLANC